MSTFSVPSWTRSSAVVIAHVSSYWSSSADKGFNEKQRLNKPKLLRKDSKQEDRQHTQDLRMSVDWGGLWHVWLFCLSKQVVSRKINELVVKGLEPIVGPRLPSGCALPGEFLAFSPTVGPFQSLRLKGIERSQWIKISHLLRRNDEGENRDVRRTCGGETQTSSLYCSMADGQTSSQSNSQWLKYCRQSSSAIQANIV